MFFVPQVKRFLEHVNRQLPNVSKNLFILFNHWDLVVDQDENSSNDDSDDEEDTSRRDATVETVKRQHLHKVQEFLVQGLQANAVLDRTFFVSGKEACKVQENEKKGKPCSESGISKYIIPPPHSASYNIAATTTCAGRVSALVGHRKRPPVQVTVGPCQHKHYSHHHMCQKLNALNG